MKRIISLLTAALLALCAFAGCSGKTTEKTESGKLSIVTTIFPEYDWVKNITQGAENVQVSMLLDDGADMHSYQPSADDIISISTCDVFVYVGGESDKWAQEALKESVNKDMTVINLMDIMGDRAKLEESVEGMQEEEEEEEEEPELDEHVWLSLRNASLLCGEISDRLCEKDASNKALYQSNTQDYLKKLSELDEKYTQAVSGSKKNTLIFADRFPFRYLIDDYNLSYYAAFAGCSTEANASFETIAFLGEKLSELKLDTVLKIDNSDDKIPDAVIKAANASDVKILSLNSMQNEFEDNEVTNYLNIMKSNLDVLKKALG